MHLLTINSWLDHGANVRLYNFLRWRHQRHENLKLVP